MKTAIAAGRAHEQGWSLPRKLTSPGVARELTADTLAGWGIDPGGDAGSAVILCVSELVTNAVTHGAGRVTLSVEFQCGGAIVCHVRDHGKWQSPAGNDPEHGRGLKLIIALAEVFETASGGDGTTVMFRIPLTPLPVKRAA